MKCSLDEAERRGNLNQMKDAYLGISLAALVSSFVLLALTVGAEPSALDVWAASVIGAGANSLGSAPAHFWGDVTAFGGGAVVTLLVLVVVGFLLVARHPKTAAVVAGCATFAGMSGILLKQVFQRARPDPANAMLALESFSFPSGHSLISAAVYPILGVLLAAVVERKAVKIYCVAVGLVMMFLIGVSRIYLGVHYATDVLAGWCLGLSFCLLSWEVFRRLQRAGLVEEEPIAQDTEPEALSH